jgi:hypothetical protein
MISELASEMGFRKEHLSPYYPWANGQVEAINKYLKNHFEENHQPGQIKLDFDVISDLMGLPNLCQNCNKLLSFSTCSWSQRNFSY